MRSLRTWNLCRDLTLSAGLALIVSPAFVQQAAAQDKQATATPEYRILGHEEVLLQASSKTIGCLNSYQGKNLNGGPCIADVNVNGVSAVSPPIQICGQGWFLLTFPLGTLAPDHKYLLTYREVSVPDGESATNAKAKGAKPAESHNAKAEPSAIILDTYPNISVSHITEPGRYAFTSVTAFGKESDYDDYKDPPSCKHDPEGVGQIQFTLGADQSPTDQKVLEEKFIGLINVLGAKFTSDTATLDTSGSYAASSVLIPYKKSRKPPSGKSDAEVYANVNIAAATGASFAWGLDGKIAACPNFKESWQLVGCPDIFATSREGSFGVTWLSATANGGHNTGNIKGQAYTDSVDWNLPITYIPQHGSVLITGAPDFETDWELDRRNFLGTLNLFWQPENNTQQNKIDRAGSALADPVAFLSTHDGVQGYEFDAQFGFEGGRAIDDTIQKPSKGTASPVSIPAYAISRAVSQFHGLYQLWRFSFDDTFIGRYLFLTENSASESKANIVYPLRLTGWKGINKLTGAYKTNPNGAFSLSVTYTDGFDAPKFKRTNSVQAGLNFMY